MNSERDEKLAAWLDGCMPADEAAAFEAELAADPELAARARRWKENDARIAAAFAPVAQQPLDPAMLEKLGLGDPPVPIAANDNPPWWRRYSLPIGSAIAASLLVVALAVQQERSSPQDSFELALETTPSLGQARLADGRLLQPSLTVRAADGRYCREYRISGTLGLACREKGKWIIEAEGKGAGPAGSGEIGVAAGGETAALDAAYKRIGASDPLDAKAEAALIARGW